MDKVTDGEKIKASKTFLSDEISNANIIDSTGIHLAADYNDSNVEELQSLRAYMHQYVNACIIEDYVQGIDITPLSWLMNGPWVNPVTDMQAHSFYIPFIDCVIVVDWLDRIGWPEKSGIGDVFYGTKNVFKHVIEELKQEGNRLPAWGAVAAYYMDYFNDVAGSNANEAKWNKWHTWMETLDNVISFTEWNRLMDKYTELIGIHSWNSSLENLASFSKNFYNGVSYALVEIDSEGNLIYWDEFVIQTSVMLIFFILGEYYKSGLNAGDEPLNYTWVTTVLPELYNRNMNILSSFNLTYSQTNPLHPNFWKHLWNYFIEANREKIISYYEDFGWLQTFTGNYAYEYTWDGIYHNGEKQDLPTWTVL